MIAKTSVKLLLILLTVSDIFSYSVGSQNEDTSIITCREFAAEVCKQKNGLRNSKIDALVKNTLKRNMQHRQSRCYTLKRNMQHRD